MKKFFKPSMMKMLLMSLMVVALLPIIILFTLNIFLLSREEYYKKLDYLNEAAYDLLDDYNDNKQHMELTVKNLSTILEELDYIDIANNKKLRSLLLELRDTSDLDFLLLINETKIVIARTEFDEFGDELDLPEGAESVFEGETVVTCELIKFKTEKRLTKGLLQDNVIDKSLLSAYDKDLLKLSEGLFLIGASPIYKDIDDSEELQGVLIIGKYLDKEYFNKKKNTQWPAGIDVEFLPAKIPIRVKEENVVSIPIYSISTKHVANIIVWFDPAKINQIISKTKFFTVLVFIFTLLVSIFASFVIARMLVKPIKKLNSSVKNIIDDEYDNSVNIKGPIEIGELCDSFNKMIESLKEKRAMQKDFVATLTHDLRVPLYAEEKVLNLILTEEKYQKFDNQKMLLEGMVKSNKDLLQLINTLLDTFKLEEGRYKLRLDKYNIVEIIQDCIDRLNLMAEDKKIKVHFTYQEPEIFANVDSNEIKRVVTNLLSNSIKFTSEGGLVEINVYQEDNKVCFFVKDNGIGMSEEDKVKVFTRYNSNAKKLKMIGTGLGLYLSYCIIIQHKGQITVESELNRGSTFIVTLPVDLEED